MSSLTAILAVHPDIIKTHILNKLDGQTLASVACASRMMYTLCTQDTLWAQICNNTWPSTKFRILSGDISTFPAGHRSFFSDSFSSVNEIQPCKQSSSLPSLLISAVDIRYKGEVVYSEVQVTNKFNDRFLSAPFRVDILDPYESISTSIKYQNNHDAYLSHIYKHMILTWIVIDPTRKRAMDISSLRPVSVKGQRLTGNLIVRYGTVIRVGSVFIQTNIVVTCRGEAGGPLHVKEVSMVMQDMNGKSLCGRASLVILQEAMESERRKRDNMGEQKQRYQKNLEMKKQRKKRDLKTDREIKMVCMVSGLIIFILLWVTVCRSV